MAYTTESFIKKVTEIHKGKYDYSKVDYKGSTKKVTIICPIHGEFQQAPVIHIRGCGCPKCGKIKSAAAQKQTIDEWIKKARQIHGDKYDYSKVDYKGWDEKVCIICPEHGEFWQNPTSHIAKHHKRGCPKCGENLPKSTEEFIKESINLYGNKYDYSKTNYINGKTKVCITCPIHGDFYIIPNNHLKQCGCPKCNKDKKLLEEKNIFIKTAKEKYKDKYDYSKVIYKGKTTAVTVICPIHGEFKIKPIDHIKGYGCPECRKNENALTYQKCYEIAKQYQYELDFKLYDKKAFNKSKRESWLDDFNWLIKQTNKGNERTIYVYEFPDNSAYVGLTNWLEHRDYQHRQEKSNSSVYEYSINNNIDIPQVKILEENVDENQAGISENKWINFYRNNGWNMINKVKGGSLGALNKNPYTKEMVITETKNYKNQEEVYNNNRPLYNAMRKYNLIKQCFPNTHFKPFKNDHYNYTENYLIEITAKYPKKSDLRKYEYRVYHWLYTHNKLYDFYEKPKNN